MQIKDRKILVLSSAVLGLGALLSACSKDKGGVESAAQPQKTEEQKVVEENKTQATSILATAEMQSLVERVYAKHVDKEYLGLGSPKIVSDDLVLLKKTIASEEGRLVFEKNLMNMRSFRLRQSEKNPEVVKNMTDDVVTEAAMVKTINSILQNSKKQLLKVSPIEILVGVKDKSLAEKSNELTGGMLSDDIIGKIDLIGKGSDAVYKGTTNAYNTTRDAIDWWVIKGTQANIQKGVDAKNAVEAKIHETSEDIQRSYDYAVASTKQKIDEGKQAIESGKQKVENVEQATKLSLEMLQQVAVQRIEAAKQDAQDAVNNAKNGTKETINKGTNQVKDFYGVGGGQIKLNRMGESLTDMAAQVGIKEIVIKTYNKYKSGIKGDSNGPTLVALVQSIAGTQEGRKVLEYNVTLMTALRAKYVATQKSSPEAFTDELVMEAAMVQTINSLLVSQKKEPLNISSAQVTFSAVDKALLGGNDAYEGIDFKATLNATKEFFGKALEAMKEVAKSMPADGSKGFVPLGY